MKHFPHIAHHMPVFVFCLCFIFFFRKEKRPRDRERYVHFVFDVTIIYRSGLSESECSFFFVSEKKKTEKDEFKVFFRFVYGIREGER